MVVKSSLSKINSMGILPMMLITGMGGSYVMYKRREYLNTLDKRHHTREITDKCYMDIGIGNKYAGRIIVGLYSKRVPMTCENFVQLCQGYKVGEGETERLVGYRNTLFYKVQPGRPSSRTIFGGDTVTGSGQSRGMSIYGRKYPDENYHMRFVQDGDLASMGWGPNTNSSHFMITLLPSPPLHGRYVVFGTVLRGMKIVRGIGDQATRTGQLVEECRILQCGLYRDECPPPVPQEFLDTHKPTMTQIDWERYDREVQTRLSEHEKSGERKAGPASPITPAHKLTG
ncbi:hypothetical protein FOZ63_004193 [Perkinsus olseni]|uniref:Peptidyl-prolyl cis-trans isomerase n=1 Tax=Perkinsus olseni TaxID=32597 RepID=A0A7J6R4D8_PEROL|nr:hypothetical protein FOZ63_004193 [Perkinsus olseni]KAF4743056.1 hypothetical protein FOZ62_025595 [Perkinsus olseni]